LVRYLQTFTKLRTKLDEILSPEDSVTPWSKVQNLPYLCACLDAAMCLTTPVSTDLTRRIPPEGVRIDGEIVFANTNVSIAAYTAHRDPTVFEDPEAYCPDRWLAQGSDRLKDMLAVFISSITGTLGRIGRNLLILMQAVCIALMVYDYEFALPIKRCDMQFEEWFNLWPLKLPMKVWRRELDFHPKATPVTV
jgi:cytochrome P450